MSKNRLLIELNSDKLKHTSRAREETEGGGGGYKRERDGEKNRSRSKKNIVYRRQIFRVLYYHCSMMKSINLRWLMVVHSVLHRYSTLKTSCHINFPFHSPEKRVKRKKFLPKNFGEWSVEQMSLSLFSTVHHHLLNLGEKVVFTTSYSDNNFNPPWRFILKVRKPNYFWARDLIPLSSDVAK